MGGSYPNPSVVLDTDSTMAANSDSAIASQKAVKTALATKAGTATTVNGHALSSNVTVTATDVSLGSVTNDAQTKAAIFPNTAPAAGQVGIGNAGGTAYAPVSISGDCTLASTGAETCTKLNGVLVATAATASTIAERNASGEMIAVNTVATGKTPMATDTNLAIGQIPAALITPAKMSASTFDTQTDAGTVTWAIGSVLNAQATLTFTVHSGNRTLNITGPVVGGNYVLKLKQDGTGGEGLILGTGCTWLVANGGAGAVTLTATTGALDVLTFTYDGTNCLAVFAANLN